MLDIKACEWLLEKADAPIRYRVLRELLDEQAEATSIEPELMANPTVQAWLAKLPPQSGSDTRFPEHGSFDHLLENALLKSVQLGLHAKIPQVAQAIAFYLQKVENAPPGPSRNKYEGAYGFYDSFIYIMTVNLLAALAPDDRFVLDNLLGCMDSLHGFTSEGSYDIYVDDKERATLKGIPTVWKERRFIKVELFANAGVCWPLVYDIIGLSTLYALRDPSVDEKVNSIIAYISNDQFHQSIADGYGIIQSPPKKYHSMGWDPKYPGWSDVGGYLHNNNASKLLFYALYIAKYPLARKTRWFADLLSCLSTYKTPDNRYLFPKSWLSEKQGYAVQGKHLSFGEDRSKRNWAEIESTFYMQLLLHQGSK
ncbi:MAG: hypothetical protein FWH40_08665 [Coriobacteriia bacterium]|nr:hypothetical protein [Coriobacteriia bacterium]